MVIDYGERFNELLDSFSQFRFRAALGSMWAIKGRSNYQDSIKLMLYLNALNDYDPAITTNFLTDSQVEFLFSQARSIIGIDNGQLQSQDSFPKPG